jgi:hypothetical protein
MGKEQEELLLAMDYAAHQEAHKHLSEVLEMMDYTSRMAGISIGDAHVEASATTSLSAYDQDILRGSGSFVQQRPALFSEAHLITFNTKITLPSLLSTIGC